MANIMSLLNLTNRPQKNGYDLSQRNVFSAKVGELLPVFVAETLPDEDFEIEPSWFSRTQPVNTCAFTRIKEYYDVFFVPTNLLWNRFNSFVSQMQDNPQQAASIKASVVVPTQQPYFKWSEVWSMLQNAVTQSISDYDGMLDICGMPRASQSMKLLEYLGYGDFSTPYGFPISEDATVALNPFPLLAYQKIYADFYRDQQWEESQPYTFNVNWCGNWTTANESSMNLDALDVNVDEDNIFTLRYANFAKDYFQGLLPSSQFGDVATVSISGSASNASGFVPLTYQTAGYSFPESNIDNFNYFVPAAQGNYDGSNVSYPAATAGDVKNVLIQRQSGAQGATTANSFDPSASERITFGVNLASSSVDQTTAAQFNILALRRAEAYQRWAEITQANQKDYMHQMKAHFDADMSPAYSEHVQYLGGTSHTMDITEVVNTNLNSGEDSINTNSASISGKGVGSGYGKIKFKTPCHGIIMCIYHAQPILDYAINGIERFNLKNAPTDYAIPEYDHTGMIPIPAIEFVNAISADYSQLNADTPLGYGLQYQDYKTKYDVVRGAFVYGGLNSWVSPMSTQYYLDVLKANDYKFTYQIKKVNPSVLDSVFAVNAAPVKPDDASFALTTMRAYYQADLGTDQLLINLMNGCKAIRKLDRNGLPY